VLVYLTLVCGFFFFEALHELVDLALLLVEDLVLLGLAVFSTRTLTPAGFLLLQVLLYLLYVTLVRFDHFADISNILLELFDLSVVLLDPVEEAFTCLRERQIHFIGLEFEVVLALDESRLFLLEVLSPLLEGVLLQARLGLNETGVDLLEVGAGAVHLLLK